MARISSYRNDSLAQAGDRLLGTDLTGSVTRNFPLSFLSDFILDGNRFIGTVAPGHYGIVNDQGNAITQGGACETTTTTPNPVLTGATFTLHRDSMRRLILIVGNWNLPFRLESLVGQTWTADGFSGTGQRITAMTDFILNQAGTVEYNFVLEQVGNLGSFTGSQTLTNFALSSAERVRIAVKGDLFVGGNIVDANGNPIVGSSAPFIVLNSIPQDVVANQIAVLSATEQYYNVSSATQPGQTLASDFTNPAIWTRVGDSAVAGGGFRFVFTQATPAETWVINHNRGGSLINDRFVDVTVYEDTGSGNYSQVIPTSVIPNSSSTVTLTFTPAMVAGIALITG